MYIFAIQNQNMKTYNDRLTKILNDLLSEHDETIKAITASESNLYSLKTKLSLIEYEKKITNILEYREEIIELEKYCSQISEHVFKLNNCYLKVFNVRNITDIVTDIYKSNTVYYLLNPSPKPELSVRYDRVKNTIKSVENKYFLDSVEKPSINLVKYIVIIKWEFKDDEMIKSIEIHKTSINSINTETRRKFHFHIFGDRNHWKAVKMNTEKKDIFSEINRVLSSTLSYKSDSTTILEFCFSMMSWLKKSLETRQSSTKFGI